MHQKIRINKFGLYFNSIVIGKNLTRKILNNNEPLFFHQLEHKTISLL